MNKLISKNNIKNVCKEILQYLVLFLVYVIVFKIASIPDFYIGDAESILSFTSYHLFELLLMLAAMIIIATKPTPITVVFFGYFIFQVFGNQDHVLFMMLFPLIYFMAKKSRNKSSKNRVLAVIIGVCFLLADFAIAWHQGGVETATYLNDILMYLLALIVACVYDAHKPKLIKKFFDVAEEHKESRVLSLTTRIIIVFSVAVLGVFAVVIYTMSNALGNISRKSAMEDGAELRPEVTAFFQNNAIEQSTLKDFLKEKCGDYEGIWVKETSAGTWYVEYQDDAKTKVENTLIQDAFTKEYDTMLWMGGSLNISKEVIVDGHHLLFFGYYIPEINDEDWKYGDETLYDVYLIKGFDQECLDQRNVIKECFILFFVVFCLGIPTVSWFIELIITRPINLMTGLVSKYVFENEGHRKELEEAFTKLAIKTGDEIENLYNAFGKTILDMNSYINNLNLKNEQIQKMQLSMIMTMANVVENRDSNTGMHIKRTAEYVNIIARKMQDDDRFKDVLTEEYVNGLKIAAPLHDMGKIHVSDAILNKPDKLNEDEYAIMKTHTIEGKKMLKQAIRDFGEFDYLLMAVDMAGSHHERYDGCGYPEGLKGEEIPLCARIMAVADVFDALVSRRSYKEGMPLATVYGIIEEGRGKQFDPDVVDAFLASKVEIENYYNATI